MLAELRGTGSKHIVQIFKSTFYTAGTGVHPRWDPIPYIERVGVDGKKAQTYDQSLPVCRIYLEHCEQEDLWRYDQKVHGRVCLGPSTKQLIDGLQERIIIHTKNFCGGLGNVWCEGCVSCLSSTH